MVCRAARAAGFEDIDNRVPEGRAIENDPGIRR